jgi:hypothetical protein
MSERDKFVEDRITFYKVGMVKIGKNSYKIPRLHMEVNLKKGNKINDFLKKYVMDSFRVNNNYRRWS